MSIYAFSLLRRSDHSARFTASQPKCTAYRHRVHFARYQEKWVERVRAQLRVPTRARVGGGSLRGEEEARGRIESSRSDGRWLDRGRGRGGEVKLFFSAITSRRQSRRNGGMGWEERRDKEIEIQDKREEKSWLVAPVEEVARYIVKIKRKINR